MPHYVDPHKLREWCSIPATEIANNPRLRVPFRLVKDSNEMGRIMATELVELIEANNKQGKPTRAIIPCGPSCWYQPWRELVKQRGVSLKRFVVFHMDECLDWQGKLLPKKHPYNFKSSMENDFYGDIPDELNVPLENRFWAHPSTVESTKAALAEAPVDITYGGWGQDGHVAYNQSNRDPFTRVSLEQLRASVMRVQENNVDTKIALAQRKFGGAYQFVPPMSVTLGLSECLSARRIRLFSDTGAWKQTALRVALFSEPTPEYPMTLLQEHSDALITATVETAQHPIASHPEWELF